MAVYFKKKQLRTFNTTCDLQPGQEISLGGCTLCGALLSEYFPIFNSPKTTELLSSLTLGNKDLA